MTVNDSFFSGDSADSEAGSIYSARTLIVSGSTFSDESASFSGGAIFVAGTAAVTNSTFDRDSAIGFSGGAIFSGATLTVTNSTFFNNHALQYGGAIVSVATLTANNDIFSQNSAGISGAGIANRSTANGSYNVFYTNLVSGSEDDCNGCTSTNSSFGVNPNLLPLGAYGGTTQTLALLQGSPAICVGSSAAAVDASSTPLTSDQRGFGMDPSCASGSVDAGAVQTNQYVVTTLADQAHPSSTCIGGGACSLRDAIGLANTTGGDITFMASLASVSAPGTILLGQGSAGDISLPAISGQANIFGLGANQLTVSGNSDTNVSSVFTVNTGATALLYGLTVAKGNRSNSSAGGGGINNSGALTVLNSAVSGNAAGNGASGGGIYSAGTLAVLDSTVSGNTDSQNSGGGIYSVGTLTVTGSTVSGNSAVCNLCLSGALGGGIYVTNGWVTMTNSVVAANSVSGSGLGAPAYADIDGTNTGTGNVASADSSATSDYATTLQLSPLQYNGTDATLQTMIPLPGSPAICAGLQSNILAGVTTDERGFPNTTTYPGYASNPCVDAGAVQTNYPSVAFVQQPAGSTGSGPGTVAVNTAISPVPTVAVLDTDTLLSSNNTDAVNGVPVTLTYSGGAGELTGPDNVLTETTANGVATYTLAPNATGTDFTLSTEAIPVVGSQNLDAVTSDGFNVISQATTTTASDVYALASPSSQSVTLTATVTNPDETVNEGAVQFTVLAGVGTATSEAVSGSSASVSYALPSGLSPGQYTIYATYTDPAGNLTTSSDSSHNLFIQSATVTTNTNGNITVPWSASSQSVPVTIDITAGGAGVNEGQLTIPVIVTQIIQVTKYTSTGTPYQVQEKVYRIIPRTVVISSSPYQFSLNLPAGMAAGTYPLQFSYSDGTGIYGPSSDTTHTLTVTAPAFVVNNSGDAGAGATDCAASSTGSGPGACTLRDALAGAAADDGANITFDATVFAASNTAAENTIALTGGTLEVPAFTTITGPTTGSGATLTNLVTINGGGPSSAFSDFDAEASKALLVVPTAALSNLNIEHGSNSDNGGGGITNETTLTLTHDVFTGNSATAGASGGAILNGNVLTVTNCTFSGNSQSGAGGAAGAILNGGGATLTITGSTFSENTSSTNAGAILNQNVMTVSNSTFTRNVAAASGGAIAAANGTLTVTNSTFSANVAGTTAGGIGLGFKEGFTLADSIVSGNGQGTAANITKYDDLDDRTANKTFAADQGNAGGNIVGEYNDHPAAASPISAIDLAPLGSYGGSTQTMIPLPGSPAICAGITSQVTPDAQTGPVALLNLKEKLPPVTLPTTDQRGLGLDANCPSGSADAGAVQTNYSIVFTTEPEPLRPATQIVALAPFQAAVTLSENGVAFFDGTDAIPIALTLTTGPGGLLGGSGSASAATGIATYSALRINLPGVDDQFTATLSLNGGLTPAPGLVLTQTSNLFSVNKVPTTTTLGVSTGTAAPSSSISITPGQSVTLTATVASSGVIEPVDGVTALASPDLRITGTVSFYDGSTLLGTVNLSAGDVATYSTTKLEPGVTHQLTATYNGNSGFASSSDTSTVTVTVAPLDFTMTLSGPTSLTVIPGGTIVYTVKVDPDYGSYAGAVTFTVSGLPPGATVSFSPATIAANGGPQTITVTIQTAALAAMLQHAAPPPISTGGRVAPFVLAFLLLFGMGSLRRNRRALSRMLCVVVLLLGGAATAMLSGCGANGYFSQAPHTYTIIITFTAGGITHTETVTLNIQ